MPQVILQTQCKCRRIQEWDWKTKGKEIHAPRYRPLDIYAGAPRLDVPLTRTFRFDGLYELSGDKPLPLFVEIDT